MYLANQFAGTQISPATLAAAGVDANAYAGQKEGQVRVAIFNKDPAKDLRLTLLALPPVQAGQSLAAHGAEPRRHHRRETRRRGSFRERHLEGGRRGARWPTARSCSMCLTTVPYWYCWIAERIVPVLAHAVHLRTQEVAGPAARGRMASALVSGLPRSILMA